MAYFYEFREQIFVTLTYTQGQHMSEQRRRGLVVRMVRGRGFGFIRDIEAGLEYFFHVRDLRNQTFDLLSEGDAVMFTPTRGDKGARAADVLVLE